LENVLALHEKLIWTLLFQLFAATWKLNYSYSCQMVNYGNDPDELKVIDINYVPLF